jgi:hypothetical protein
MGHGGRAEETTGITMLEVCESSNIKFREVLFICPICVYGSILLAKGPICV